LHIYIHQFYGYNTYNLHKRRDHFTCVLVAEFLFHETMGARIVVRKYCTFVVVFIHLLIIFKIIPFIKEPCHRFKVVHQYAFYIQHFCSYPTENVTPVYFEN
jgi:hypothetical protein